LPGINPGEGVFSGKYSGTPGAGDFSPAFQFPINAAPILKNWKGILVCPSNKQKCLTCLPAEVFPGLCIEKDI
jgi:hypothetical protein